MVQARDIGRSDQHLMKIEQMGRAFAQGHPLGDRDLAAMELQLSDVQPTKTSQR